MSASALERPSLLHRLAGVAFPIYFSDALEPRATLDRGATLERVLICSVPKAGTYLLGGLLARLGMGDSRLHVAPAGCSDYRFAARNHALERPSDFHVPLGIDVTLPLIGPGQFVVGHLPCTPDVREATADFRLVVAIRDLRDAMLSMMRFLRETGRTSFGPSEAAWRRVTDPRRQFQAFLEGEGVLYLRRFEGLADWLDVPGTHPIRFETITGDEGCAAQLASVTAMAAHAGLVVDSTQAQEVLGDTLGALTLTWSGGRSRRDDFWDDEVAATFESIGGVVANRRFGYA
jgi:hypothetical protein